MNLIVLFEFAFLFLRYSNELLATHTCPRTLLLIKVVRW
jgi:hypothetical protein